MTIVPYPPHHPYTGDAFIFFKEKKCAGFIPYGTGHTGTQDNGTGRPTLRKKKTRTSFKKVLQI